MRQQLAALGKPRARAKEYPPTKPEVAPPLEVGNHSGAIEARLAITSTVTGRTQTAGPNPSALPRVEERPPPAFTPPTAPAVPEPALFKAPVSEPDLVRVVFEFGDKRRVVYVDKHTAEQMLTAATALG